jgi:hypothetical protein
VTQTHITGITGTHIFASIIIFQHEGGFMALCGLTERGFERLLSPNMSIQNQHRYHEYWNLLRRKDGAYAIHPLSPLSLIRKNKYSDSLCSTWHFNSCSLVQETGRTPRMLNNHPKSFAFRKQLHSVLKAERESVRQQKQKCLTPIVLTLNM